MTRLEVLDMLSSKKIDVAEASRLLSTLEETSGASRAASVSILSKTGRIRIQNGAQADLTAAQVCAVLKVADKLVEEMRKRLDKKQTTQTKSTTRDGEEDSYTAILRGDMLFGYSAKQVSAVEEFIASYGKKSSKKS